MFRSLALLLTAFLCASLVFGQGVTTGSSSIGYSVGSPSTQVISGSFSTSTGRYNTPGVTGAPYSAEQVQERVQTLADGTHITQKISSQRMWRDSQGRTRTERPMGMSTIANAPQFPAIVTIVDPVVGCEYILDTQGKVAHRIELQPMPNRTAIARASNAPAPAPGTAPGVLGGVIGSASAAVVTGTTVSTTTQVARSAATADPNRPQFTSESLGSQVIEGVLAEGRRTTTVYPVGSQGNDRPITVTSENWISQDLRMTVLTKSSDPRSGESTMKLINISRNEPDPLLFMPPADYSIVEETGPQVTIRYTVPRQ